eukprot:gb/GECG01002282.1/.p1 GENE.gb/GECG01002282.1/~~gb/GECG01002282.1/.p1  ORF type:complete len:180 (+),score=26.02 gb/GECG01002282.1/:1-540(+)
MYFCVFASDLPIARFTLLQGLAKEIHDLRNKHDQTEAEYEKLEKERDELYSKFEDAIRTVQDRVEFRNKLLEQKLDAIAEEHENKSAQLQEVISAAELDPSALEMVNERLDSILGERSRMLKDLQYQVARVTKAHNDALRVYEAKLQDMGIDTSKLGHKPLPTSAGLGPAGLVARSTFK